MTKATLRWEEKRELELREVPSNYFAPQGLETKWQWFELATGDEVDDCFGPTKEAAIKSLCTAYPSDTHEIEWEEEAT